MDSQDQEWRRLLVDGMRATSFSSPFDPVERVDMPASKRSFLRFFLSGEFADCELTVQEEAPFAFASAESSDKGSLNSKSPQRVFKLHKMVLVASSSFFHALFLSEVGSATRGSAQQRAFHNDNEPQSLEDELDEDKVTSGPLDHRSITIPAGTIPFLETVFEFMYSGLVTVQPDMVVPVLVLSDLLLVDQLQRIVRHYLQKCLSRDTPEHVLWFLKNSSELGCAEVQDACIERIAQSMHTFAEHVHHLPPHMFIRILKQMALSVQSAYSISSSRQATEVYLSQTSWPLSLEDLRAIITHRPSSTLSMSVIEGLLRHAEALDAAEHKSEQTGDATGGAVAVMADMLAATFDQWTAPSIQNVLPAEMLRLLLCCDSLNAKHEDDVARFVDATLKAYRTRWEQIGRYSQEEDAEMAGSVLWPCVRWDHVSSKVKLLMGRNPSAAAAQQTNKPRPARVSSLVAAHNPQVLSLCAAPTTAAASTKAAAEHKGERIQLFRQSKVITTTSSVDSNHDGGVQRTLQAYVDFFDHISIRNAWRTPPFTVEEVRPLLALAAEITVWIRRKLDILQPGFKLRMLSGSVHEYLWSARKPVVGPPGQPSEQESKFVRDVVHYSFRDRSGYTERLTQEELDRYIDNFIGEQSGQVSLLRRVPGASSAAGGPTGEAGQ